jgi:hypothetical protein
MHFCELACQCILDAVLLLDLIAKLLEQGEYLLIILLHRFGRVEAVLFNEGQFIMELDADIS